MNKMKVLDIQWSVVRSGQARHSSSRGAGAMGAGSHNRPCVATFHTDDAENNGLHSKNNRAHTGSASPRECCGGNQHLTGGKANSDEQRSGVRSAMRQSRKLWHRHHRQTVASEICVVGARHEIGRIDIRSKRGGPAMR
jgi:hypothetical protein